MGNWTIEEAKQELAYIKTLVRDGGDANVPRDLVHGYAVMQSADILRAGKGREDFRDVAEAIQDEASAFLDILNKEVA